MSKMSRIVEMDRLKILNTNEYIKSDKYPYNKIVEKEIPDILISSNINFDLNKKEKEIKKKSPTPLNFLSYNVIILTPFILTPILIAFLFFIKEPLGSLISVKIGIASLFILVPSFVLSLHFMEKTNKIISWNINETEGSYESVYYNSSDSNNKKLFENLKFLMKRKEELSDQQIDIFQNRIYSILSDEELNKNEKTMAALDTVNKVIQDLDKNSEQKISKWTKKDVFPLD